VIVIREKNKSRDKGKADLRNTPKLDQGIRARIVASLACLIRHHVHLDRITTRPSSRCHVSGLVSEQASQVAQAGEDGGCETGPERVPSRG